jgi:ParB/RepB/Spo0J family partition protein
MTSGEFHTIPIDSIIVPPDRQRQIYKDIPRLAASIKDDGLIEPLLLDRNNVLICGGRRYFACKMAGYTPVSVQYTDEVDPRRIRRIELMENLDRMDLEWQEEFLGVDEIFQLFREDDPEFSQADLAKFLRRDPSYITKIFVAVEEWKAGNPLVVNAKKKTTALGNAARAKARRVEVERYEDLVAKGFIPKRDSDPVLNLDFNEWVRTCEGQKFNFIHCDFPYGIESDSFNQGGAKAHGGYEDTDKVYWTLCKTLRDNLDRLCLPDCHFMFWFSMHNYQSTLEFFKGHIDFDPFPLVWHKTDNAGILPDWNRGPRRVYETAFFGTRGDRKIVRAGSNARGEPAVRDDDHMSIKPEPMLKYFFEMIVDTSTRMLDPTAGSGSSLRAAMSLDARYVLGLEKDKTFCEDANREIQSRMASSKAAE